MAYDESTSDWQARVGRDAELLAKALFDSATADAILVTSDPKPLRSSERRPMLSLIQ